jgi:hypothetical protein
VTDEREQQTWLSNTLRRSPSGAVDGCLDAETLAAWADGGLSAKAAAAVELHASNCPQCLAVLAAMERSTPIAPVHDAWTRARWVRWVVPLTAAATAVAIWIAVPDRPVTSNRVQDLKTAPASPAVQIPVPMPVPVPEAAPVPGPAPGAAAGTADRRTNAEPATPQAQFRDEFRRENAAQKAPGVAAGAAADAGAAPEATAQTAAPPPPVVDESASTAAGQRTASARADASPSVDTLNERATLTARRALSKATESTESIAQANSLYRWRIVASRIERSINGAKNWTRTAVPPGSPVSIRAVDADRAVVRTSDNAEFYTVDGGRSWTRVQENSAAPF